MCLVVSCDIMILYRAQTNVVAALAANENALEYGGDLRSSCRVCISREPCDVATFTGAVVIWALGPRLFPVYLEILLSLTISSVIGTDLVEFKTLYPKS